MPNNTKNIIKFQYHDDNGDRIKQVSDFIKSENKRIDFNKIIPQPENIFKGDISLEDIERCRRDGIQTWYDWNIANWGTQWNAYNIEVISENLWSLTIKFDTAWNSVSCIIKKLCELFKDVDILYVSACEGGWFVEKIKYSNQVIKCNSWNSYNDEGFVVRDMVFECIGNIKS